MENTSTYDTKVLVELAWIALIALATIIIPFTVVAAIAFKRAPVDKNPAFTFSQLFERAKALQMITVILIVVAVVFLALFRIIDSNGAVGILGGIAGYVLGGLNTESNRPPKKVPEANISKEP
jgi:hypothetical protein